MYKMFFENPVFHKLILILAALAGSFLIYLIFKKIIIRSVFYFIKKSKTKLDDFLIQRRVFDKFLYVIPALVFYYLIQFIFSDYPILSRYLQRCIFSYIIVVGILVITALFDSLNDVYKTFRISQSKPIKGYVQLIKLFTYLIGSIFVITHVIGKSPWVFVSGLGAMMAVILLIFKDTILGFVASMQLSMNNMVHIGDWIEMPAYNADGDVIDITLHTVKVQNWDKTITTIPSYTLITESFKNWRGMAESGGRRIKRSIYIDMNSIQFLDQKLLIKLQRFSLLKDYLQEKTADINNYNKAKKINSTTIINGRRLTNIGTFRAYIKEYIRVHPQINQDMTIMVRQLQPVEKGLPLEIYIFTKTTQWAAYEEIQADIFDHLLSIVHEFNLKVFQIPTGRDIQSAFLKK